MKKIFYLTFLFVIMIFSSCSKDNHSEQNPPAEENPPTEETIKQVERIFAVNTGSGLQNEYRFQYNEDHTIKSIIKISNQISFTMLFEYTSNSVIARGTPSEGDTFDFIISFSNDIITNITVNDQEFPVSYNAENTTYGMLGGELLIDADGDMVTFSDLITLDYDTTHKGAFHDCPSMYQQIMFLLLEENFLTIALPSKPVNSLDTGLEKLDFSNTYDSEGYIKTAVDGGVSLEYHYFE